MPTQQQVNGWIKRYETLNEKAIDKRRELLAIERQRSKEFASMLPVLRDMSLHLKNRPLCKDTNDYPSVEVWVENWVKPFLNLQNRQVHYYVKVANFLHGMVSQEKIEVMGIEKAKELSKVAQSKGRVDPELVEQVINLPSVRETRVLVKKLLYGASNDHANGDWGEYLVEGPKEFIDDLKKFLEITRRQEGYGPSDAEILSHVLNIERIEIEEAEERRRDEIRTEACKIA